MKRTILLIVLILFFTPPIEAGKLRARKSASTKVSPGVAYSSARLSRATNSVVLTFLNLSRVKRVTYTLSYVANGTSQGVVGTLTPSGQTSDSRDLYFGTCSHGVCTAHYNVRNVTLLIQTELTNGGFHSKRYRIKV